MCKEREDLLHPGHISLVYRSPTQFVCSYKLCIECVFIESNKYNTQNIHSVLYKFIQSVKFMRTLLFI